MAIFGSNDKGINAHSDESMEALRNEIDELRERSKFEARFKCTPDSKDGQFYMKNVVEPERAEAIAKPIREAADAKERAERKAKDEAFLAESHPEYLVYCNGERVGINGLESGVKATLEAAIIKVRNEMESYKRLNISGGKFIGEVGRAISKATRVYVLIRVP